MNLNHLAIFRAVAEAGSVSGAALDLHISQPAVSKQLREFEARLGVPLVDRLPKGVRLTSAGTLLLDYARQIAHTEAAAERALRELADLQTGSLAIGASMTIGNYLMPRLLARFQRQFPGVDITLEIANTEDIQQRLLADSLDLGFTEGFVDQDRFAAEVFAMDELVVIAGPNHPLAERQEVAAEELARATCILREPGSGTRAVLEQVLEERGLHCGSRMALGSPEAIKQAVASGAGISVVSRLTIETELHAGTLVVLPVRDLKLARPLHRVSLRNRHPSRALERFLALLEEAQP
ncbi:LysR family transcriptional regulator [Marinobacteraceae bacterium S3BR75-40.1]